MSQATGTRLRIADITYAVAGLTRDWTWVDRGGFEAFLVDQSPDVVLRLHVGHPGLRLPLGDLVYSVEGWRNVYLDEHTWAFEFRPYERALCPQRPPHQLLVFDRAFTVGDLYVPADTTSERPAFILGLFLFELFASMLPLYNGMMLHASGISDGRHGIIFAGSSGAGKSTLAGLWQECDGVKILHDDRIILRKKGEQWLAYPVAGIGQFRAASAEGVVLEAIFLVSHATENQATRKGISQAATSLLAHISLPPYDSEAVKLGLRLLDDLLGEVPVYELGFLPDQTAVSFVRDVVRQGDTLEHIR